MNCDHVERRGLVQEYVAGRLSASRAIAFERHFFECDRCYESVRLATLARDGFAIESTGRRRATLRSPGLVLWTSAAIAVFIGASVWGGALLDRSRHPGPNVMGLGSLGGFGDVDGVPAYAGSRADAGAPGDSATALFRKGMAAYEAGDFETAAAVLEASIALGSDSPTAVGEVGAERNFYLGVSELAAGDPAGAVAPLERAGGNPQWHERAAYYLAKAHLRLGHRDDAVQILESIQNGDSPAADRARRLLTRIREAHEP